MENKKRKDGKEKKKMIKGKTQLKKTSRDILKHKKTKKNEENKRKGQMQTEELGFEGVRVFGMHA